jgi:hypothetical protein
MDKVFDSVLDKNQVLVCLFCTTNVHNIFCQECMEYKGIMTMKEWEEYTGEVWED